MIDSSSTFVGPEGESTSRGGWCGADSPVLPHGLLPVHRHQSRTCLCLGCKDATLLHDLGGWWGRNWYKWILFSDFVLWMEYYFVKYSNNLSSLLITSVSLKAVFVFKLPDIFLAFWVMWRLYIWVLDVGVLLCRGNRLLTGSNTRWLRLWEVDAVRGVKPQGKVCNGEERSAARCAIIAELILSWSWPFCFNYVAYHCMNPFMQRKRWHTCQLLSSSVKIILWMVKKHMMSSTFEKYFLFPDISPVKIWLSTYGLLCWTGYFFFSPTCKKTARQNASIS